MTAPVRVSMGLGRYGYPNDNDFTLTTYAGGSGKPALLMHHGRGSTALSNYQDDNYNDLFKELAEEYTVCIHDCSSSVNWGNQAAVDCITPVMQFLVSNFGVRSDRYGMLAVSMGGGMSFTRARQTPSQVAFVAGIVPLGSVRDLMFYQSTDESNDGVTRGVYANEIDAAYGGTYSTTTHSPTHDTYTYRASYPASTVKTGIWYSKGDKVTRPQFVEALKAAQPAIDLFEVRDNNNYTMPAHGAAVEWCIKGREFQGSGTPLIWPRVADWIFDRKLDRFS